MSTSRHPIALKLEGLVGSDAKLLATVMGLPLLDGIFPALVLAGALGETVGPYPIVGTLPLGMFQVGILVFGGSATLAVVLAEMDGTRAERVRAILAVGTVLTVGAAFEAAVAPTLASVLELHIFERFAALVIVAIAAKTASARIGEYLPRPGVIVGAGLIASLKLDDPTLAVSTEPGLVAAAAGSAIVGSGFALAVALFAPRLRARMALDRFRFGSAVALGLLALSILKLPVGSAPLLIVGVTALFAFDPDGDHAVDTVADAEGDDTDVPSADASTEDAGGVVQDAEPIEDALESARDRAATDGGDAGPTSTGEGEPASADAAPVTAGGDEDADPDDHGDATEVDDGNDAVDADGETDADHADDETDADDVVDGDETGADDSVPAADVDREPWL